MVDLGNQYKKIEKEIDFSIKKVLNNADYINGSSVVEFSKNLSSYLDGAHVIPCANGTDALQIAFMALNLQPGDEVIVPSFTYFASVEILGLLNLTPVVVDVNRYTFNIDPELIEGFISEKTKAIIAVHLFGQCADMEIIMKLAIKYSLYVIEDAAQAIGGEYHFSDGTLKKAGTIGHIGCTSFFPSKNLSCYGDGGAVITNDTNLAEIIKMISNHGQKDKYFHTYIGVNSRLDSIQAAILNVKLKYLEEYNEKRKRAADYYYHYLGDVPNLILPVTIEKSNHVYHQFTIQVDKEKRDSLKRYLETYDIPSMIYYPMPVEEQIAFKSNWVCSSNNTISKKLSESVLSLPIHTEILNNDIGFISEKITDFFKL